MEKSFKLIGTALVAVLMCVIFSSCSGDDYENWTGSPDHFDVIVDGMGFRIYEDRPHATLVGFDMSKTSLNIPSQVYYKKSDIELNVEEIGYGAAIILKDGEYIDIVGNPNLQVLNLPKSLLYIGMDAFKDCYNLTSVYMGENMIHIGENAFRGCSSLHKIHITAETIGSLAFSLCKNLSDVTLADNVKIIGSGAFSDCESLTSIRLPKNIDVISREAFADCNLNSIYCHATRPPVLEYDVFSNTADTKVYVPKSNISAYLKSDWGKYFNKNNFIGF